MLAAWMALESRSFSLVDLLDFIVTVNKGIEPRDCWIFLPPDISGAPISVVDYLIAVRRSIAADLEAGSTTL